MTSDLKLDLLIIDNIVDLDATARRAEALGQDVWGALFKHIVAWADGRNWCSSKDADDNWVAPREWMDGKNYVACFFVAWGPGDEGERKEGEPFFELSRFAGVGGSKICLWQLFKGMKRTIWRPLLSNIASRGEARPFLFDDTDGLYIDCTPPLGSLAAAVENEDYAAAFEPLTRALDAAHEHWQLFDQLLKKARS